VLVGCGGAAALSWSDRRRDGALGIISARLRAGGVVTAPFVGAVLVPHMGWRNESQALALITWLLCPSRSSHSQGWGARNGSQARRRRTSRRWPDAEAGIRTEAILPWNCIGGATFWIVAVSFMASGFSQLGAIDEHPLDGQWGGLCPCSATVQIQHSQARTVSCTIDAVLTETHRPRLPR